MPRVMFIRECVRFRWPRESSRRAIFRPPRMCTSDRRAYAFATADTLTDAGPYDASDALLKAGLPRSSTP